MGRSVIDSCLVDAYEENRKEWRHKVGKMLSATEDNFLAEVTRMPEQKKNVKVTDAAVVVEGEDGGNTATGITKAKRKRRRKRKTNDDADDDNNESKKTQKTSSSATISTETIMNIMNVNK
mmetsp:Transcript_17471/g.40277  ORF Transcript_17471/g.40277 Transcript_17471/m.40277 type:complete len:121 (-) Transcript_17471:46-408(-)